MKKTKTAQGTGVSSTTLSRRGLFKGAVLAGGAIAAGASLPREVLRTAYAAGSDAPIKVGFQVHRTGIGALYGRWYERVANAAAAYMNERGGIAGRPIEIIPKMTGPIPNEVRRSSRNWPFSMKWILSTVRCSLMWSLDRRHGRENSKSLTLS